jgi:hypothetical protein
MANQDAPKILRHEGVPAPKLAGCETVDVMLPVMLRHAM